MREILKSAIITVFCIAVLSWAAQANPASINSIRVEEVFQQLFTRLGADFSLCKFKKGDTPYSRLDCAKPTLEALETELIIYKSELLVEYSRKQDIKNRLQSLKHWKHAARIVLNVKNPQAWLRDNIDNDIESVIVQIETKHAEELVKFQSIKQKKDNKQLAQQFINNFDCENVGNNLNKAICTLLQE